MHAEDPVRRRQYSELSARQQQLYNFHRVSLALLSHGFTTLWCRDDWNGPDFLALPIDGTGSIRKVQLKGRCWFDRKYEKKDIWLAFPSENGCYFYPHDELLLKVQTERNIQSTPSWQERGAYHFPRLSEQMRRLLEPYRLSEQTIWCPNCNQPLAECLCEFDGDEWLNVESVEGE